MKEKKKMRFVCDSDMSPYLENGKEYYVTESMFYKDCYNVTPVDNSGPTVTAVPIRFFEEVSC